MTLPAVFGHARLLRSATLAALVGLAALACGGGGDGGGGTPAPTQPTPVPPAPNRTPGAVAMRDNVFRPAVDTIAAGGTVTWTNEGTNPHTSTGQNGLWDSGVVNPGGSFARRFPQAGSFPYACTLHPGMTGTVVVR